MEGLRIVPNALPATTVWIRLLPPLSASQELSVWEDKQIALTALLAISALAPQNPSSLLALLGLTRGQSAFLLCMPCWILLSSC
jgi:hypothetical protein